MKIFDTHAHLYSEKFDPDMDQVISRAKEFLDGVFLPNINEDSVASMHRLVDRDSNFFFPMMGLHPCDVSPEWEKQLETLKNLLDEGKHHYVGIGETGLDLYWDKTTLDRQQQALEVQIQWAKEYELPIILHARDAIDETADLIEKNLDEKLTGIFHCFDGTVEQAERIRSFGTFKMGIGGIVTYRKDVQNTVQHTPLDLLVLETDSPYLPPVPHRKDKPRRNESSYTRYVAKQIAELHGVTYEEVARVTNQNVKELFSKVPWSKN